MFCDLEADVCERLKYLQEQLYDEGRLDCAATIGIARDHIEALEEYNKTLEHELERDESILHLRQRHIEALENIVRQAVTGTLNCDTLDAYGKMRAAMGGRLP